MDKIRLERKPARNEKRDRKTSEMDESELGKGRRSEFDIHFAFCYNRKDDMSLERLMKVLILDGVK